MALFSRGKRGVTDSSAPDADAAERSADPSADVTPDGVPRDETTDGVGENMGDALGEASVGISVSSFRGVGATPAPAAPAPEPARQRPPAEAPPQTETVPGLRDNVLVREALAELPESPLPPQILNVARQLLQGHVFLRVKGDARALLSEGKDLPLGVATQGEAQYVLVYSSGEAIQAAVRADGDTDTSAMAQPVLAVFRHVLAGSYAGIIIDHSSAPARVALPRDLLERALKDMRSDLAVKTTLTETRTHATAAKVVAAISASPMWLAANRSAEGEPIGIAESRTPEGERLLDVFSHPLEVIAMERGDQPVPVNAAQLAAALAADEALTGFIVDPAGPWIRLSRDDLAPLIALAP